VRVAGLPICTLAVVLGWVGCSPEDPGTTATGGTSATSGGSGPVVRAGPSRRAARPRAATRRRQRDGGNATGGNATGGNATGGKATGGNATGGKATGGGATGGGSSVNCSGTPLSGGTQHCSSNQTGTVGSFSWSIWSSEAGDASPLWRRRCVQDNLE